MKVKLNFDNHVCEVTKEDGDPRFHRRGWSGAESTFLYHVKQELIKQGYDVIKKRMWKDGHLVDDTMEYIRSRDLTSTNWIMIYNSDYAIRDAGETFNENGFYILTLDFYL